MDGMDEYLDKHFKESLLKAKNLLEEMIREIEDYH